ncbi:Apical junction molecule protein [Burkholderia pseudomallei MSHR1043]|nr:Apical junction molecule protein [Burkholderia pseudomallei MSHR1043]
MRTGIGSLLQIARGRTRRAPPERGVQRLRVVLEDELRDERRHAQIEEQPQRLRGDIDVFPRDVLAQHAEHDDVEQVQLVAALPEPADEAGDERRRRGLGRRAAPEAVQQRRGGERDHRHAPDDVLHDRTRQVRDGDREAGDPLDRAAAAARHRARGQQRRAGAHRDRVEARQVAVQRDDLVVRVQAPIHRRDENRHAQEQQDVAAALEQQAQNRERQIEHLLDRQRPEDVHAVVEIADLGHQHVVPESQHGQHRDEHARRVRLVDERAHAERAERDDHRQHEHEARQDPRRAEPVEGRRPNRAERAEAPGRRRRDQEARHREEHRDAVVAVARDRLDRAGQPWDVERQHVQPVRQVKMQDQHEQDRNPAQQVHAIATFFQFHHPFLFQIPAPRRPAGGRSRGAALQVRLHAHQMTSDVLDLVNAIRQRQRGAFATFATFATFAPFAARAAVRRERRPPRRDPDVSVRVDRHALLARPFAIARHRLLQRQAGRQVQLEPAAADRHRIAAAKTERAGRVPRVPLDAAEQRGDQPRARRPGDEVQRRSGGQPHVGQRIRRDRRRAVDPCARRMQAALPGNGRSDLPMMREHPQPARRFDAQSRSIRRGQRRDVADAARHVVAEPREDLVRRVRIARVDETARRRALADRTRDAQRQRELQRQRRAVAARADLGRPCVLAARDLPHRLQRRGVEHDLRRGLGEQPREIARRLPVDRAARDPVMRVERARARMGGLREPCEPLRVARGHHDRHRRRERGHRHQIEQHRLGERAGTRHEQIDRHRQRPRRSSSAAIRAATSAAQRP